MALLGWTEKPVCSLTRRLAADDVRRVHVGGEAVRVAPRADRHDDLFERGVAGPLADTVDGALDLPGPGAHRGEAVRYGEPKVVMAVHRDDGLVDIPDVLVDARDELVELLRRGVAHGVGNVDRGRAGVDGGFEQAVDVVRVAPGGVHRRELDVVAVLLRPRHVLAGQRQHLLAVLAELVEDVNLGAGEEDVDAPPRGVAHPFPGGVNVLRVGSRQTADDGPADFFGDALEGRKLGRRAHRKAGLDDVHAQPFKLVRDLELLVGGHGGSGGLFAVPEGGIEDQDSAGSWAPGGLFAAFIRSPLKTPGALSLSFR